MNQKLLGVLIASFLIGAFLVSVSATFLQQSADVALDARTVGEDVYTTYCTSCHGELGVGDGPAAYALEAEGNAVTDFVAVPVAADEVTEDGATAETVPVKHYQYGLNAAGVPTDESLHETIMYGRSDGAMPAFPLLSAAQREAVIAYIKTFRNSGWPSAADVAAAEAEAAASEEDSGEAPAVDEPATEDGGTEGGGTEGGGAEGEIDATETTDTQEGVDEAPADGEPAEEDQSSPDSE